MIISVKKCTCVWFWECYMAELILEFSWRQYENITRYQAIEDNGKGCVGEEKGVSCTVLIH